MQATEILIEGANGILIEGANGNYFYPGTLASSQNICLSYGFDIGICHITEPEDCSQ